jgi:hypothetical protein
VIRRSSPAQINLRVTRSGYINHGILPGSLPCELACFGLRLEGASSQVLGRNPSLFDSSFATQGRRSLSKQREAQQHEPGRVEQMANLSGGE